MAVIFLSAVPPYVDKQSSISDTVSEQRSFRASGQIGDIQVQTRSSKRSQQRQQRGDRLRNRQQELRVIRPEQLMLHVS